MIFSHPRLSQRRSIDRFDRDLRGGFDFVHLRLDHPTFVRFSGGDLDVENDANVVIDSGVPRTRSPLSG